MAEPFLKTPNSWFTTTLEPDPTSDVIISVETGNTPDTKKKHYWGGQHPWLTPKDITTNGFKLFVSHTERTISDKGMQESSTKLMPPGTVMVTKRAPVGSVAINTVPMATNQGFLNFICGSRLRPIYLANWFIVNKPYLDAVANGSTYPELYRYDLFEFQISFPPIEVQDKIISIINSTQLLHQLISTLEKSSNDFKAISKYHIASQNINKITSILLPKLLSGQIDVSITNGVINDIIEYPRLVQS